MSDKSLPPIHETVRFWHPEEQATLRSCIAYRQRTPPGWSLTWLRDATGHVLDGGLGEAALRHALDSNVPNDSRSSVWEAVQLLRKFAAEYQWRGVSLPTRNVAVGLGFSVQLRPVGMYQSFSKHRKCLLAVQPRLADAPNLEQIRIWLSSLYYEFCCDPLEPLEPLIVDLSRSEVTRLRALRELSPSTHPLLAKPELDTRFEVIVSCWKRAVELVPLRPTREKKRAAEESKQKDIFGSKPPAAR